MPELVDSFKRAAQNGDSEAQTSLGLIYAFSLGVDQDYKLAAYWYEKAARQGHSLAQVSLGLMYDQGLGVTQDYIEAHKWMNIAYANGDADAIRNLGIIEGNMTKERVAEAQRRADAWIVKHK